MYKYDLALARLFPDEGICADYKLVPEDFQVSEIPGFEPSGEGEHLLLHIRKTGLTTDLMLTDIARALSVQKRDIGYCGLKDKQAVTDQWVSVNWPIKKELPFIEGESWQVVRAVRHNKKLKRGVHKGNHFYIRLRNIVGDREVLERRLSFCSEHGFPNYFGEQRFGIDANNLIKAEQLFRNEFKCKPFKRSIYYSAVRSFLFNRYLSLRVEQNCWNQAVEGDCFNLEGSNAIFGPEPISQQLIERLKEGDIHPVGPLPGEGETRLQAVARDFEEQAVNGYLTLVAGLINAHIKKDYRPLRVKPKSLNWQFDESMCVLEFDLPSGSYATALLGQLIDKD